MSKRHGPFVWESICELHFVHGLSYGQIAKGLKVTRGAVAGVIHRHRAKYEPADGMTTEAEQ